MCWKSNVSKAYKSSRKIPERQSVKKFKQPAMKASSSEQASIKAMTTNPGMPSNTTTKAFVYLAPFSLGCLPPTKVPCALRLNTKAKHHTSSAARTRTTTSKTTTANSNTTKTKSSTTNNSSSSGSCCQRTNEHNKNYYYCYYEQQNAAETNVMSAITADSVVLQRIQLQQEEVKQEKSEQQLPQPKLETEQQECISNKITPTRTNVRKRHRHFHTNSNSANTSILNCTTIQNLNQSAMDTKSSQAQHSLCLPLPLPPHNPPLSHKNSNNQEYNVDVVEDETDEKNEFGFIFEEFDSHHTSSLKEHQQQQPQTNKTKSMSSDYLLANTSCEIPSQRSCSFSNNTGELNVRLVGNVVKQTCWTLSSLEDTVSVTATDVGNASLLPTSTTISNTTMNSMECRCFNYEKSDIMHYKPSVKETVEAAKDLNAIHEDEEEQFKLRKQPQQRLLGPSQFPHKQQEHKEEENYKILSHLPQLLMMKQHVTSCLQVASAASKHCASSSSSSSSTSCRWLLLLVMLMLTSSANCWAGRQDAPTNCTFPARWEGSWFLSGYQQSIHIKGSQFSYRGKCAASDGNKYLIVDEKGCHRCLVIYEKHKNVLQYKESECEGDSMYMHQSNPSAMAMRSVLKQSDHRGGAHPNLNGHSRLSSSDQYIMRSNDDMNDCPPDYCKGRETLQNLCDQIPGDALLYSLFRESAEPVKCPLKGPFIFTYNRGHGECKSPVSNIESCTEDSRLLLSFQACPDVQGTESTVEELTCLAAWKDGNSRYLVGLVSHHHAISNEERYRCFVYEKISSIMGNPALITSKDAEYKLAQSGDATCNGLDSAEVGSRIMSLRKPLPAERCDFPVWFKGPRHWHALMGNAVYNYHSNDGSVHIIKPNGYMETRALCEQINKQTATEMMAVVHYTTGCQSGFMCMMFYRRDTHVIEIQTGQQASRLEDACAPDHFDVNKMPYITLLASNPDPQICPMEGLYNLRGAIGPPYLSTRHKRNHNNKPHLGHGHHHHNYQEQSEGSATKRRSLSLRNSARIDKDSWHSNARGLPARSRRDAETTTSTILPHSNLSLSVHDDGHTVEAQKPPELQLPPTIVAALTNASAAETTNKGHNTSKVTFVSSSTDLQTTGRKRRDAPGCITNYKAQRQLWVGCTDENIIDVRPLCTDEGDEEYSCHGSWNENGTVYIIARHKASKHGVCISYRPTEGNAAKLVIGDACYRGIQKPPEHHLVAELSVFGKCGETGSGAASTKQSHLGFGLICLLIISLSSYSTNLGQLLSNFLSLNMR